MTLKAATPSLPVRLPPSHNIAENGRLRLGGLGISRRFDVVQRQLATLPHGLREMQQVWLPTCSPPVASLVASCTAWQAPVASLGAALPFASSLLPCLICAHATLRLHAHALPPAGVTLLPAA